MRIALATCTSLPDWEVDDHPFHAALKQHGVRLDHPAWTDEAVDWSRFDACLIRTTWDYASQRDAFLAWSTSVATQTRLFNPPQTIEWNTCKSYLEALRDCGIPTIPSCCFTPGDQPDLAAVMVKRGWRRGFLKPIVGATARGTCRFSLEDESLADATRHLMTMLQQERVLLQPYLEQVEEEGEWSAIMVDGHFTHAVRKIPQPGDYRVQDDFGATDEPYEPTPVEHQAVGQVMDALTKHPEWTGQSPDQPLLYARVDFLRDGDTSLLNEVELVEPSLFFRHGPHAATRLAEALVRRCYGDD